MFRRKETMTIKELMNPTKEVITKEELEVMNKGVIAGAGIGLPLVFPTLAKPVSAAEAVPAFATQSDMSAKLMDAFSPLIDLVQALAYPVAMVVVLGGAIMVMISQKEKGYSMLMSAGLGLILVNVAPMVLNILIDAMKSVV